MTGEQLDDAVRIVEDAIDATSDEWTDEDGRRVSSPSDRTGRAVVDALLEAGWHAHRPRPRPDLTPLEVARFGDPPCRPGTCPKCDRARAACPRCAHPTHDGPCPDRDDPHGSNSGCPCEGRS